MRSGQCQEILFAATDYIIFEVTVLAVWLKLYHALIVALNTLQPTGLNEIEIRNKEALTSSFENLCDFVAQSC